MLSKADYGVDRQDCQSGKILIEMSSWPISAASVVKEAQGGSSERSNLDGVVSNGSHIFPYICLLCWMREEDKACEDSGVTLSLDSAISWYKTLKACKADQPRKKTSAVPDVPSGDLTSSQKLNFLFSHSHSLVHATTRIKVNTAVKFSVLAQWPRVMDIWFAESKHSSSSVPGLGPAVREMAILSTMTRFQVRSIRKDNRDVINLLLLRKEALYGDNSGKNL